MLVKCKACTNKVDRKDAFKVVIKGKNHYYCNASEYEAINIEKESRLKVIDQCFELLGGEVTNTALFKELTDISKVHTYKKMNAYMEENYMELDVAMVNVNGATEFPRIRYLMAILKNSLGDYVEKSNKDEIVETIDIVEGFTYTTNNTTSFLDMIEEME